MIHLKCFQKVWQTELRTLHKLYKRKLDLKKQKLVITNGGKLMVSKNKNKRDGHQYIHSSSRLIGDRSCYDYIGLYFHINLYIPIWFFRPWSSFLIIESMTITFSLLFPPALAFFGPIDKELSWFIAIPGVEIGPEINNGILLLDFIECMMSRFLVDHSLNTSLLLSSTTISFSKTFIL